MWSQAVTGRKSFLKEGTAVMAVSTAVIIEAGIGALTLGFAEAGFKVIEAFEKDKKAVNIYRHNVNGKISEYSLSKLPLEEIPDADVIVINLGNIPSFKRNLREIPKEYLLAEENLRRALEIIKHKNPAAFCFVMNRNAHRTSGWSEFVRELSDLCYRIMWQVADSRKMTGFPVTEAKVYIIGCRLPDCTFRFPEPKVLEKEIPFWEFISKDVEDGWYYDIGKNKIEESSRKDGFLCWKRDRYTEQSYVGWNQIKMPMVRIDGRVRKLTHREVARLKGFPESFDIDISNKACSYRLLVYEPNVQVTRLIAENLNDILTPSPFQKMQMLNSQKFEQVFLRYLRHKNGTIEASVSTIWRSECSYRYKDTVVYFELKFYSSDFSMKQNIYKACEKLAKKGVNEDCIILVLANDVPDEVKMECKNDYGIFLWDVKNLLWLFEEYAMIKNEFIALLNYTTDMIEPEKPDPYIFETPEIKQDFQALAGDEAKSQMDNSHKSEKVQEELGLKEKLQRIKPGKEQSRQYEEVCIEILRYVLADYLMLWQIQEKTDNGMYRFDLCCKIKNMVDHDFFNTIRQYFNTKYIVFEFKNYSEKITQKEIYTTEKYLYEKALRKAAIIISRKGADDNALAAARGSLREIGKLILCLSDKDLLKLLDMKDKNERPVGDFFEAMLDDLLIHLEK